MKKIMLILTFFMLVLASLGCSSETVKDFREVSWGSKINKVISSEEKRKHKL